MPRDISSGLPDLDVDAPAGPNLEFDAAFGELERAAQGKPEQQYGGTVIPAEDPDWKDVASQAETLLERTYDLRVLVLLAVARLQISGVAEFFKVIGAIRELLESRWAFVHPQLDPEDDNDPTFRANALLPLSDTVRVLRPLRALPLAASRRDGPVSWRTISIFTGAIETEDNTERKSEQVIRAAFTDTGVGVLQPKLEMYQATIAEIGGIDAAFNNNCGYGYGPDLSNLKKLLQECASYLLAYMPADDAEQRSADDDTDDASIAPSDSLHEAPAGQRSAGPRSSAVTIAALNSISSREEAMKLLDLVCRYYEDNEPSSPLPLLIDRARKLAGKGFLEILQELAPDGLMQAQVIVQSREQ